MTLYVVQARGSDEAALVKAQFVKDGFTWGGFWLGWIWLLYRRLWLAAAVYIALEVGFYFLVLPHAAAGAALACDALAKLFVGLEGNRLRQAKGARRAALTDIIEARNREAAEAIFYARHAPGGMPA